jgi:acetyl esterase/lipase
LAVRPWYDHQKIALGGNSASGGLVVAAIVAMRHVGEPLPVAGVCISSWVDILHGWHHVAPILPEAQQAMACIGEFVRTYVA